MDAKRAVAFLVVMSSVLPLGVCACGPLAAFVRTGPIYAPRPEDAPVRVFLTRKPDVPFTEIGMVEVSGGDMAWRVDEAKYAARERGGDAIIWYESYSETVTDEGSEDIDVVVKNPEDGSTTTATVQVPVCETYTYQRDLFVVARLAGRPDARSESSVGLSRPGENR